jgi:hypothetical protein
MIIGLCKLIVQSYFLIDYNVIYGEEDIGKRN